VQYFERAVFERHPENAPPYDVLLSQLGRFSYAVKYPAPVAQPSDPQPGANAVTALVLRVVDGDTIEVQLNGQATKVRYIGMNTPETVAPGRPVECYGPEASAANKALVAGQTVTLEKDVSETDQYGRLLRYVWVGPTKTYPNVNRYRWRTLAQRPAADRNHANRGGLA
jgi:endonuclease YncB( thermonuclease family)